MSSDLLFDREGSQMSTDSAETLTQGLTDQIKLNTLPTPEHENSEENSESSQKDQNESKSAPDTSTGQGTEEKDDFVKESKTEEHEKSPPQTEPSEKSDIHVDEETEYDTNRHKRYGIVTRLMDKGRLIMIHLVNNQHKDVKVIHRRKKAVKGLLVNSNVIVEIPRTQNTT